MSRAAELRYDCTLEGIMTMTNRWPLVLVLLLSASVAHAHHISGTVYCDVDHDGNIDDPGDTKLANVTIRAISQTVNPGETFSDATDANGFYSIGLPARTDLYQVAPFGLPGGWIVVVPGAGFHSIQIITGSSQDSAENVNFLLQGCAPPPTTTSSSTSTSSTSTSTSSTATPTTSSTSSTSTSSTTSTTLLTSCPCEAIPFLVGRQGRFNNDATIAGSAGVNGIGGRIRIGKNVFMPDGTSLSGDVVEIGNASSVFQVFSGSSVKTGFGAIIRNGSGQATLPLVDPFCPLPDFACGPTPVAVAPGDTAALPPGVYGKLRVLNGATLRLSAGDYTFCDVKMGRLAKIEAEGPVVMYVDGSLRIGTASYFGPTGGAPLIVAFVSGKQFRVSQGAVAIAKIVAPFAKASFGRDAQLDGCFCTDQAKSDKHITLQCTP